MRVPRVLAPALTGAVLVGALVVGSGAFDPPPPARTARIAALERDVKCPTCVDLSVAQSDASSSVALRQQIVRDVDRGESDATILAWVVSRYGTGALLDPPTGGLGTVLWAVPLAVAVGALASCTTVVLRRRRP